ncbi:MAG TPA: O-antigen ligase family protein, partial [Phycisphaerae bacterium]|nr:O-antigen ligase family protein [Phycisphaerae bacterium]
LDRRWLVRLALFVITGTAATVVVKCAYQHFVELPDTIKYFEEHRAELLRGNPNDPARPTGMEHDYEMRLRSGGLTGFYGHSNLLASQLILFAMAALALIVDRSKAGVAKAAHIVPAAIFVGCVIALFGTQSKGALAALIIALIAWLGLQFTGMAHVKRPRTVLLAGWIGTCVIAATLVVYLQRTPDALGRSILFRTMYWEGGWEMLLDRGPFGLGANNFGRHFTQYKSVECPEEVESPHSWPMQFATEWGVLGLIGFLAMAIGVSVRATSRVQAVGVAPAISRCHTHSQARSIILWTAAVFTSAFVPWLAINQRGDPVFLALQAGSVGLPLFLGMLAVSFDSAGNRSISDAPVNAIVPALAAGLIGFLAHTSIDLALFAGGPATTLFAFAAIMLAAQECPEPSISAAANVTATTKWKSICGAAGILTGLVAILLVLAFSNARVALWLDTGRAESSPSPWSIYEASDAGRAYRRAHDRYLIDATAGTELIEQLLPRVATPANSAEAIKIAEEARRRDPFSGLIMTHQSALQQQRYHLTHDMTDMETALAFYRECVAAYPTSPHRRIQLGNLLEGLADRRNDPALKSEAVRELQIALDLEAKRVYVSLPNRMPPEVLSSICQRIEQLRASSAEPSTSVND